MLSKSQETRRLLMISGFTREHTKDLCALHPYPKEINRMILMYFVVDMLEWDMSNLSNSKKYRFQHHQIESISGHKHVVCVGKPQYVLSSSMYKRFYFEIQLVEFKSFSLDFILGYIKYPFNARVARKSHFLGGKDEHSLYISGFNHYFEVYSDSSRVRSITHNALHGELCKNDKIGIEFNFAKNKSFIHYNGSCIGLMANKLPSQLIPAISLYHKDIVIACSQWKVIEYAEKAK